MDHAHFRRLGLTCNPFGALTLEAWVEVAVVPDGIRHAPDGDFDVWQVLGQKGRGKTTALLWLAAALAERGEEAYYERIEIGQRGLAPPLTPCQWPQARWLLIDEAQRLGWRSRRRLLRLAHMGTRLVLGSHADWEGRLARRGQRVKTLKLARLNTRDHLREVIAARLAYASLPDESHTRPYLTGPALDLLWDQFSDDLRGALDLLYEVFQRLERPGPVTRERLAEALSYR